LEQWLVIKGISLTELAQAAERERYAA
jgi:hypothetical protein